MECNDIRDSLVDYVEDQLPEQQRQRISAHLETCESCQHDYQSAFTLARYAEIWHDEAPPVWQAPRIGGQRQTMAGFFRWFPTMASAAALMLVIAMYVEDRSASARQTVQPTVAAMPSYPLQTQEAKAHEATLVRNVLESSRSQRQRELEVLVKLLKAEMDRRSLETEESLRYLIAHQIEKEQELDELRSTIEQIDPERSLPGRAMQ